MPLDLPGWSALGAIAVSALYGFGSALIPVLNAEAYVAAAQTSSRTAGPVLALALALGQSTGKLVLFSAARKGKHLTIGRRSRRAAATAASLSREEGSRSTEPASEDGAPAPTRWSRWVAGGRVVMARLLALVASRRWGIPIVALAATVGLPPIYVVALLAGASRMRAPVFFVTVLVGRSIRFTLLAYGIGAGIDLLPQ